MANRVEILDYKVGVLDDKGYVRLKDYMGDDLAPVNDAKVSYDRHSTEFGKSEERLLNFLGREEHTSPFRHSVLKFEVYAPLLVARQWWKHIVGGSYDGLGEDFGRDPLTAWNESSRRYITEEPTFYLPSAEQWRRTPENKKQGSGDVFPVEQGREFTTVVKHHYATSLALYERLMDEGVCPEQARLVLPAYGMYVRFVWTGSLQAVTHFIRLRKDAHAQKEIQDYARAVEALTRSKFPKAVKALLREDQ